MMRIALINGNAAERDALRRALRRSFEEARHASVDIVSFNSLDALIDTLAGMRAHHYDAIFCCIDGLRTAVSQTLNDTVSGPFATLRATHPQLHIVIASHDASKALMAYQTGAEFLHLPGTYGDLKRVMDEPLSRTSWQACPNLAVRSPGQIDNIPITDIQFVESSKRGPVIHLPQGRLIVTRGTLRGLYEKLVGVSTNGDADDTQAAFVMAGSSFLVNLDNVVASGKGALVFSDGETIIVPVRKRKDIELALEAFRRGGKSVA